MPALGATEVQRATSCPQSELTFRIVYTHMCTHVTAMNTMILSRTLGRGFIFQLPTVQGLAVALGTTVNNAEKVYDEKTSAASSLKLPEGGDERSHKKHRA